MKTVVSGLFLSWIILIACASSNTICVRHKFKNGANTVKVELNIPAGYHRSYMSLVYSKHYDNIVHYIYKDSVEIYINNAITLPFPNYTNIQRLHNNDSALRLQDEVMRKVINKSLSEQGQSLLPEIPYRFELSGKNENGLCWKDIKIGQISIGYLNVPENEKEAFDNALISIKLKSRKNKFSK